MEKLILKILKHWDKVDFTEDGLDCNCRWCGLYENGTAGQLLVELLNQNKKNEKTKTNKRRSGASNSRAK